MSARPRAAKTRDSAIPTIHEAVRLTDGSGSVIKGATIDEVGAVRRRNQGLDVVVCGDDIGENREQALKIEAAVGPWMRQQRHTETAGPKALPHFQQKSGAPVGHTFYEAVKAKASKTR